MKRVALIALLVLFNGIALAQNNVENKYRMTLKEVFDEMEKRYEVVLDYRPEIVEGREVTFALYRFEPDFLTTLNNIIANQDLSYVVNKDGSFKIKEFEYARRHPEVGERRLGYLLQLYPDLESWERRQAELKECIYHNLGVDPLRPHLTLKYSSTSKRKMDGYTIENFSLETIPGMYVTGSIYRPSKIKGSAPLILNPNGHFDDGRYREAMQYRCAVFAKMGAIAVNFDLFAWGESKLQFEEIDHNRSVALTVQSLNVIALLDYFTGLNEVDAERIGITGGSGGGSQAIISTAIDDRIAVSAPVVSVSSYFIGGCQCESGLPIHQCGHGTNNAEIAALAAPRPQILVSDGQDWTAHTPELELPYLKQIYGYYGKADDVYNSHFPHEGHTYEYSKREPVYEFMAKYLDLDIDAVKGVDGRVDESFVVIEPEKALYVFGENGEGLPANAVKGIENLFQLIDRLTGK